MCVCITKRDGEYGVCIFSVFITKREKAESEAQRGKPKGALESEIRSAISLLLGLCVRTAPSALYSDRVCIALFWFTTKREKAESEAQRGKPKGTLESEMRSAISLLGQRPPRYTGVGRW